MALRNGLLVHGPTHWAAAVRTDGGEIKAASGRKPRLRAADPIPGVRGVARLGRGDGGDPARQARAARGAAAVPGPGRARRRGRRVARRHAAAPPRCAARAARRPRPRLLPARALRPARRRAGRLPRRRAQGDRRLRGRRRGRRATRRRSTSAAARTSSRRCSPPTSPGTLLLRRAVERPGPLANGAVALASSAAAVEVFAWCERNAETPLARALKRPGFEIQRLVGTREPDERQLEVGRAALAEILRAEGVPLPFVRPSV